MARRLAIFVFTAAIGLLLSACSGGKSASSNNAATSAASATAGAGKTTAGDAAHGRTIFMQNCAACHGAAATGGVGPALRNEKSRKNFAQAIAWIKHPQPPMPKLYPSPLSEKDVRDVAAYVESL